MRANDTGKTMTQTTIQNVQPIAAPPAPASTTPAATESDVQKPAARGAVRQFFGFLWWIITGFGLIGARRKLRAQAEEIVVYSVHRAFFLWSVILVGFIAAACVHRFPHSALVWGWIYLFVMLYTIVTLLFDISTLKALLWGGIFCFVWLISKYFEDMRHVTVLSGAFRYLASLRPELSPGFASVMSWLLLVPWIGALFHTFSRGRTTFSPNSIEEWYMGEGRDIIDRSGLKFRSRYRDLFETVLGFGAGDLEALDSTRHVVRRWENILFLVFQWKKLDEILHQRAAIVDNAPETPVEVEQVRKA
jgi:hypothetical protein